MKRALLMLWVVLGCGPRGGTQAPDSDGWQARVLALEARLADDPADTVAWRELGHIRWMHLAQPAVAEGIFEANAERGDLPSRLALLVMADARMQAGAIVEHGDAVLISAAAVAPTGEDRSFADAAAEYAARRLSAAHGDLPGDDARFVAMFDPLYASVTAGTAYLPFTALQPLLSMRAAIARRHGKDYEAWYARAGCVQSWAVAPMAGHLGTLELAAVDASTPLAVDPDAVLAELACVVRVWNPTPAPGVRRLRAQLEVPGTELTLDLGSEFPSRTYLDGHLILSTDDTDRFVPERVTLALEVEPGRHTIDIVTVVPSERAWVVVRAIDGAARPIAVAAKPSLAAPTGRAPKVRTRRAPWPKAIAPLADPLYAPLRALLAMEDALADGDSDRAETQLRALNGAKRFAEGHRARAAFERADPSRGRTVSAARERTALQAALKLDPALDAARLRMLQIDLDRNEDQRVAQALDKLGKQRLRSVDGEMLRYQVQRRLGSEHTAEQALARAEALNPESCRVLLARRSIAREHDDVRNEDAIVAKLDACAGSLEIRAELAERRGNAQQARDLWAEALRRVPDDIDALEALARLAAVRDDHQAAQQHLERILRLNPFRVGSHIAIADLAASRGQPDAARVHLRRALEQIPHSNALRRAAATLGIPDDLDQWRIDGAAALAAYRASGVSYDGVSQVLVLDRSAVRVYPNGGQRQIVHIVVHLLNKEALDDYGEIAIPEGAMLLALHTIKPDGRRLEPEVIGGKEGLSLRHLEVGDVVEYEFAVEQGPSGPMPGYVDVSTFRFQSLDVPYHRTELQVIHPAAMDVRNDRRNDPPTEFVERSGDLTAHLWRADEVPRRGVEPGHRDLVDELPNVHVYTQPLLADYLGSLAVQIRESQRSNPALRGLVARLTAGKHSDREKFTAMWSWVVEKVEERGDLTVPATLSLAGRGGNRMMLLRAMLRQAGIDAELWLARDAYGTQPLPGGHPMLGSYATALLAVQLDADAEPTMVLTASKVMPPGYLPPGLRGTDAVRLRLDDHDGSSGAVKVPALQAIVDRREWDLDVEVGADGGGTVSGTVALTGMEAVFWRQALRDIDRDRVEEVFQQAELGWLRGATLDELTIEGEADLDVPLTLRFRADARGIGIAQGGTVVIRAAPMPLNTSARYAGLPRRTTGLVVPYAPVQVARLTYRMKGAKFMDVPKAATITSEFGDFTRTIQAGSAGKSTLTIEIRSTLKPGVIVPSAYPRLAEFARAVDVEEQAVIRAQ